ncbi:MAG: hypothetical protein KKF16_01670 [Euryarchaeota archaeon]|nr:hypothetical protein [Euryarchaeota archaeon]MBV1729588.1 hypothetical protein [Methanobacterium sp.]MBU4547811.1 hypothetical protein [Euryarchaeota archaeon]MBU4608550.1 hypothetical protein [Euryarchaeota archaeon]MBV1755709.1 hypothetical protein [Methanobacterium sp.]
MWLPADQPIETIQGNLNTSSFPHAGYIRILNPDDESVVFINQNLIIGAWTMDIVSFNEYYENHSMKRFKISSESKIEVYKVDENFFNTLIELNEECKLSLPVDLDLLGNDSEILDISSREEILSKYRIREPSEDDLESLLNNYKFQED